MPRTLLKAKGRRESGSFVAIPTAILESVEYAALNGNAVKALLDLYSQFNGRNNGDLTAAWSVMVKRGWKSKAALYKALHTLLEGGWIVKARQGGKHVCTLYAVTWKPIHECGGKLDIAATNTPLGTWKQIRNAAPQVDHISTAGGPVRSAIHVN